MKYKAIIFDMDGTIIHTEHIWKQVTRHVLTSRGHEITQDLEEQINIQLSGVGLLRGCQILKELVQLEESIEELALEKNKLALEWMKDQIKFIEGFVKFHTKTQTFNLKTGIATNAGDDSFEMAKQVLNLHNFFGEHMYNISHVNGLYKPNPALYLYAAARLGVDPKECIVIEDSAHGVNAALAAGMLCVGINTSGRHEQTEDAHHVVNTYEELELLLEELLAAQ